MSSDGESYISSDDGFSSNQGEGISSKQDEGISSNQDEGYSPPHDGGTDEIQNENDASDSPIEDDAKNDDQSYVDDDDDDDDDDDGNDYLDEPKYMLTQMTEEELKEAGIEPQEGDATHAGQMDLRVGQITFTAQHRDRLLLIHEVDLGTYDESRLIAANIAKHIKNPKELIGQKIIVICNCIPEDDKDIKSKTGLALMSREVQLDDERKAISDKGVFIRPPNNARLGAKVYVDTLPYEPYPPNTEEEAFDFVIRDFKLDSEGAVKYKGLPLLVEGCGKMPCTADPLKDAPVIFA